MKNIYLGGCKSAHFKKLNVVYYYNIKNLYVMCFVVIRKSRHSTKKITHQLYEEYIKHDSSESFLTNQLIMKPLLKEI